MRWRAHLVLKVEVLDSKNCEGNARLKDTDSHAHGASLMQISAPYLLKSHVGTT